MFLTLTGCGKTQYDFIQSVDNIVKVEVVLIVEIKDIYTEQEVTVIKDIPKSNFDKFISDFKSIDCFKRFGDPGSIHPGQKGFKITYYAQGRHESTKYFSTGYYGFDKEHFNKLIDKYSQ